MKYIEDKMLWYLGLYTIVCSINIDLFIFIVFKQMIFTLFIFSFIFSYKSLSYKLMKHNDFTYDIYIYHMLIVNVMVELKLIGEVQNLMIVLALSIAFGVASYFLVEKPFLGMKKRSLFKQMHKNN